MSKDRDLTSLRQELDNIQNLNTSLHEQLERTTKENLTLTDDNTFLRKKILSHQQEINNNHNECVRLESELYQQGQEIERLKKENLGFLKNKREAERNLREETQGFEKDRIVWQERESEMNDQLKALHDTLNVIGQQNEQASQKKDEDNSHYIITRELKNVQRNVKDLERRNSELTAELDKANKATNESVAISKTHVRRIQQLANELSQVKHMNQSLMEENESFQRLVFEKTMNGEFMLNPIMQRNDSQKHADTAKKVTNDISKENDFKDLKAELTRASELSTSLLGERVHKESDHTTIDSMRYEEEIRSLNNANKALKLYIEKILNRILESSQGFEEILASEWKKPSESNPSTPTTGLFSYNITQEKENKSEDKSEKSKKVERRKTLSGWHFRSTSQPQNSYKKNDKITEEPDQIYPLPVSRKSNEEKVNAIGDVPKRAQRRNSTSATKNKRFSIFSWGGAKEEEKKELSYLKPIILVQEKERKE